MTDLFGKHWYTGCTSWNHYPCRWRQSVLSKGQNPLAQYATLALRTPFSATPLQNLNSH